MFNSILKMFNVIKNKKELLSRYPSILSLDMKYEETLRGDGFKW